MMQLGMVSSVDWVSTLNQLADCLTKAGSANKADWLLSVAYNTSFSYCASCHKWLKHTLCSGDSTEVYDPASAESQWLYIVFFMLIWQSAAT